jgi:hypothetical protein
MVKILYTFWNNSSDDIIVCINMHTVLFHICLFVCFFWVAWAIFQLSSDCHHYQRQGCKFRLNRCLVLTAFSSEDSFTRHTYCDTGPPFLRSYPKDPWFYLLNAVLLAKEQSLPILNVLGLTRPTWVGLKLTTFCLISESTTTRLRQPVFGTCMLWLFILLRFIRQNTEIILACVCFQN